MQSRSTPIRRRLLPTLLAVATLALVAAACGSNEADGGAAGEPAVTVVATTTHVADLARNVGGERAEVVGLLAANADPHDHEPRPSDVEAVAASDLVLQSGGDLDLWVEAMIESAGAEAPAVELIDSVETIEGGHGHQGGDDAQAHEDDHDHADEDEDAGEIDPHWWQDPRNAVLAAEAIRDQLIALDPAGRDEYEANARRYIRQLEELDRAIAECIDSIPARDRTLVTSHDSFDYFARRYELEVVGAAIPALTTRAQPSAGETGALIELIQAEGARAVFPEAGLGDRLQQALADETDAELGGALWADTLGPEGSGAETYLEAMAANAQTVASGLSGGERSCPGLSETPPAAG